MSRKAFAFLAGWLAVVPAGLAQSPEPSAPGAVKSKVRPLSPYYPTASTAGGYEASEQPPAMPDIMPGTPVARPVSQGGPVGVPPMAGPGMMAPPMGAPAPMPTANGGPVGSACGPNGCGPTSNGCATCSSGCATAPSCGCGPCGGTSACGPYGRAWVSAEAIFWTTKGLSIPPLVTASTNPNRIDPVTGLPAAGVLGDPLTTVLYGDEDLNNDWRAGLRVRAGFWLDECQTNGIEGSFFYLSPGDDSQTFTGSQFPELFRPFFNADPAVNAPDAELVAFPGLLAGSVTVASKTKFQGFDANFRKNLRCDCNSRVDLLAGYRYLRLQDRLQITEELQKVGLLGIAGEDPIGTRYLVQDTFETTNTFNGGQVGLAGEWRNGKAFVAARGLVALGQTQKEISIAGQTRVSRPGQPVQTSVGGLLAQRTNIGSRTFDDFAIVPEATLTIGFQVTDGIRVFGTYNFLYWNNVSRAGDQIDTTVDGNLLNPAFIGLATRPAFNKNDTDFWAQGLSVGLEIRY